MLKLVGRRTDVAGRLKMYRDRLRKWECKKNLQWRSVQNVARLVAKRDAAGRTTEIKWNGIKLDRSRLTRHLERSGKSRLLWFGRDESGNATGMDAHLIGTFRVTSPPPQLCPPDEMRDVEEVLDSLRTWVQGNFESLSWTTNIASADVENVRVTGCVRSLDMFETNLRAGLKRLGDKKTLPDAFRFLNLAFRLLNDALREEHPTLVSILLHRILSPLERGGRQEVVAHMLLDYTQRLLPLVLGSNHPVARVWQSVRKTLERPQNRNRVPVLFRVVSDQMERFTGLHNRCTIGLLKLSWGADDRCSVSSNRFEIARSTRKKLELQRWLQSIESGSTSCCEPIVAFIKSSLADVFYSSGEYERATGLYKKVLYSPHLSAFRRVRTLKRLGIMTALQGDLDTSVAFFDQALAAAVWNADVDEDYRIQLLWAQERNLERLGDYVGVQLSRDERDRFLIQRERELGVAAPEEILREFHAAGASTLPTAMEN